MRLTENMKRHIGCLGYKAKDKVTGFEGIVSSVSFDLHGCIQVSLQPPMNSKGEVTSGYWFDINRLEIQGEKPVIDQPNFEEGYQAEGKQGCSDKPARA